MTSSETVKNRVVEEYQQKNSLKLWLVYSAAALGFFLAASEHHMKVCMKFQEEAGV